MFMDHRCLSDYVKIAEDGRGTSEAVTQSMMVAVITNTLCRAGGLTIASPKAAMSNDSWNKQF